MRALSFVVSMACMLLTPALVLACPGAQKAGKAGCGQAGGQVGCGSHLQEASVRDISIPQLAMLMKSGAHDVTVLDANNSKTRRAYGQIPGAQLLSSYRGYDIASELPKDTRAMLVFYCANTRCTASHQAAQRALEAGYRNVYVLPAGIAGWMNAGQPVTVPSA